MTALFNEKTHTVLILFTQKQTKSHIAAETTRQSWWAETCLNDIGKGLGLYTPLPTGATSHLLLAIIISYGSHPISDKPSIYVILMCRN